MIGKNTIKYILSLLIGLFILFSAQTAQADTIVNSDITGYTRWTAKGSPYLIYTDEQQALKVHEGATLKIEPGVTVKFTLESGLDVRGKLIAHGNPNTPITFTSIYDGNGQISTAFPGDWYGIYVRELIAFLKHVQIKYAGRPYFHWHPYSASLFLNRRDTHFTNSSIENGASNGLWIHYFYHGLIHNNTISNNEESGVIISHSNVDLYNNKIVNNGRNGIELIGDEVNDKSIISSRHVEMRANIVQNNGRNGIYLDTLEAPDIHDNVIADNGLSGIYVKKGYPRIYLNAFLRNSIGVTIERNWPLIIRANDFIENALYSMQVLKDNPKYSGIHAEGNYWEKSSGLNMVGDIKTGQKSEQAITRFN